MQNQAQGPRPHDFTSRKHFLSGQQTVSYLSEMEQSIHVATSAGMIGQLINFPLPRAAFTSSP